MTDKLKQASEHLLKVLDEICADDYIQEVIDAHLEKYGENYRPERVTRCRDEKLSYLSAVSELEAALKHVDETNTSQERVEKSPGNVHVMQMALDALEQVDPYVDQLVCYASTAAEYPLNNAPRNVVMAIEALREALEAPHYPLPDSLYPGSKDWMAGDYAERVEWLHRMYESKKRELDDLYAQMAAPQGEPVAWPKNAAEVREFFRSDFMSIDYALDSLEPDNDDKYLISAHDFLSAANWWAECATDSAPQPAAPQAQPLTATQFFAKTTSGVSTPIKLPVRFMDRPEQPAKSCATCKHHDNASYQPLSVEAYTALAHRIASKYRHNSNPHHIEYTFLPHTLEQFVRAIEAAITKEQT